MKNIYFYAGHSIDFKWVISTLQTCKDIGLSVSYGCSQGIEDITTSPYYVHDVPFFYGKDALCVKADIVVSASSSLFKSSFKYKDFVSIHMPHSLISLHMAYPEEAFDDVDILCAAGPHHGKEWEMICQKRGLHHREWYAVGYGFFDLLKSALIQRMTKRVLIAPSWGVNNLLETSVSDLSSALYQKGYEVIVRPHPMFFVEKKDYLETIVKNNPHIVLESSLDQKDHGFFSSSFLITDYSGMAFEYSFLHNRKVIFVNTPLKMAHNNWGRDFLSPIEITYRNKIGKVCDNNIHSILQALENIEKDPFLPQGIIKHFVYNPFLCKLYAASLLKSLALST